jgi:hypothetical protein
VDGPVLRLVGRHEFESHWAEFVESIPAAKRKVAVDFLMPLLAEKNQNLRVLDAGWNCRGTRCVRRCLDGRVLSQHRGHASAIGHGRNSAS